MTTNRIHFHTFDALRFFSFLLVFFHHTPVPQTSFFANFTHSGGIGVSFFFVLSGFLITYILIHEKKTTGQVSFKKFFIRRILRIWPLFYAMILFAYLTPYLLDLFHFTASSEGYKPDWTMSLLFLENYKMMITGSFPDGSPLRVMWSLCIEEHFYIIWGVLIAVLPLKRIPQLILASWLIANITRLIYFQYGIASLDVFSNIDYFAFGAIPAYLLLQKPEKLNMLENWPSLTKYLWGLASLFLIFYIPSISAGWFELISPALLGIAFSVLISFTLISVNGLKISDKYWVSSLGVFTYGLYLVHTIVINFLGHISISGASMAWPVLGGISLVLTILISMLSYHLFEKQFLKLKVYFYG